MEASLDEFVPEWSRRLKSGSVESVASLFGELGEEDELGTSIPFTETMNDIQFSPSFCEFFDKRGMIKFS